MKKTYTLASTPMIHTPGMLRFARHVYETQPHVAKRILKAGYAGLPIRVIVGLLSGTITYHVEADTVVVTA
jgi:hypothetical protein